MTLSRSLDKKKPLNNTPEVKNSPQMLQNPGGVGTVTSVTSFTGPIPPPNFLELYEQLVPGSAKRFLDEPHLEAEHRRSLEKLMVEGKIKAHTRGQWMAFTLAVICVVGALTAMFYGYSFAGLGTLLIAVTGLVGVFIYGKYQNKG